MGNPSSSKYFCIMNILKESYENIMSAHDSKGAIFASFGANVGVGISKFIAFTITGSSAMLAEAIHSVADSSNQLLLLLGGKQAKKAPNRAHPFGYGRAHFLNAFIVAIVLFSLGGIFAIYEGYQKFHDPHMIEAPIVAYIVLAVAIALESFALRTVIKEAKTFKPKSQSWWRFLRTTKSINHVVLTLEDTAALVGLILAAAGITLSLLTGNPTWDGVGTLLIGALLVVVAVILFIEAQSLLIGEGVDATTERRMRKIILGVANVTHVVDFKTLYTGPSDIFIAMKVTVGAEDSATEVARAIDEIEARLRHEFPMAKLIYVEPDLFKTHDQQKAADAEMKQSL